MTPEEYFEYSRHNFDSLHGSLSELHGIVRQHSEDIRELAVHSRRMMDAIERLANVAGAHEQRLQDLEGGEQPEE